MRPSSASDAVGEVGGAVGAVVVDHEDVGVGRGPPRAVEELHDVLRLLVRRSHDEGAHRAENLSCGPRSVLRSPTARANRAQTTEAIASAFVRDGGPGEGDQAASGARPSSAPASTVVVTGAAGWLGQNLVRALAGAAGAPPHPVPRARAGDAALLEVIDPRIEVVVGDVRDPAVIDALFDGVGRRVGVPRGGGHPSRRGRCASSST